MREIVDAAIENIKQHETFDPLWWKRKRKQDKHNVVMYRICAGLAVVVLVLGINNYISYREMNELATQTQSMEGQVEEVNATVINEALSQEQNDSAQGSHGATDTSVEIQNEEKEKESTNITEESKENESQYQWREMEAHG